MVARRGLYSERKAGIAAGMSLRLATFNIENLMNRFDFSGFRNELQQDRAMALYEIRDEKQYEILEAARAIAHTDDARQLTALDRKSTRLNSSHVKISYAVF